MSAPSVPRYVGKSVTRVEDDRILSGTARYVDDLRRADALHAVFVRSPVAHARIDAVDVSEALAMPGVVAVLTGADVAESTAPLQVQLPVPGYARPQFHPLAVDRVRHVGDAYALVVAEDRYVAEDARDAVMLEYEPLPAVLSAAQASAPDGPRLFDDTDGNVLFRDERTFGDPDGAFARAHRVVSVECADSRVAHVPMECRGGLADYDAGTGELTYWAANQAPHNLKLELAAALRHPAERVRVIAPDVGGSFGQKAFPAREDVALCFAAMRLRTAVKWVEDRPENLTVAPQARGEVTTATAAVDADGRVLALDFDVTFDQGAYPCPLPTVVIGAIMRTVLPTAYRIDALRWRETHLATNRATYGFYRGPWATETRVREALLDRIAVELGLDTVQVRRTNLLALADQPCPTIAGSDAEGVSARECFDAAVRLSEYESFRAVQRVAREEGRLLGIGFASYVEPAPGPPSYYAAAGLPTQGERAVASLETNGHLTVLTSQTPHGQGHETTLAQVAATEFGVPIEHVHVRWGDTASAPFSLYGTGASRGGTMASGAVAEVTRAVRVKVLDLAARLLEAAAEDLRIEDGAVTPVGAPQVRLPLADIALASHFDPSDGEEFGLRASVRFGEPGGGWTGGTHVATVEIDAETGLVEITRYFVVEDCGRLINPAIVNGQIRGGVAQGVGLALLEAAVYDDDGNLVTATLLDYLLPTATDVPEIEIHHLEHPLLHEFDYRGVGEGGLIAAPAAIANAVADAVGAPVGRLPVTPEAVLELIDQARGAAAG